MLVVLKDIVINASIISYIQPEDEACRVYFMRPIAIDQKGTKAYAVKVPCSLDEACRLIQQQLKRAPNEVKISA